MVELKGWNWETADESLWLDPSEESYWFCEKWTNGLWQKTAVSFPKRK